MGKAIGIKVKRAEGRYDPGASKFFGTPTVPANYVESFEDDEIFFCQIRLSDIAALDTENKLPHTGYLYIFLHTDGGDYNLEADVRYFDGEPELAVDDFNAVVDGFENFTEAYPMEFSEVDEGEACTRLLGIPSDWNYENEPSKLLLQFDPLDSEMKFLDHLDGFLYFFFGKDENDLEGATLVEEYS